MEKSDRVGRSVMGSGRIGVKRGGRGSEESERVVSSGMGRSTRGRGERARERKTGWVETGCGRRKRKRRRGWEGK